MKFPPQMHLNWLTMSFQTNQSHIHTLETVGVKVGVTKRADNGLLAALKTSGATGLHVFIPLPARTSNESALLIAQIIATRVAVARPKEATVERTVAERPKSSVYEDDLQNVLGKSVAAAYAVRAQPGATVSTPLDWSELTPKLDPGVFTIETVTERFARLGDIWAPAVGKRNTSAAIKGLTQKRCITDRVIPSGAAPRRSRGIAGAVSFRAEPRSGGGEESPSSR